MSISFHLAQLLSPLCSSTKCECGVEAFVWGFWCGIGFLSGLFCDCRKGDYYRYLAEFKTGDERKEVADQSMKAYQVYRTRFNLVHPLFVC